MSLNKRMLALYAIGLTHNVWVNHYTLFHMDFSIFKTPKLQDLDVYKYRYATSWNFSFQTIYYAIAIMCELLTSYSSHDIFAVSDKNLERLQKFRGHFFAGIIFPKTLHVFLIFWSLFNLNENYIFPTGFDAVIPRWYNHCIHTNILYLVVVETIFGKLYIPDLKSILIITNIHDYIYLAVYFRTHFETGRWLYGIFYYLNSTQIALFILCCVVVSNCLAYLGSQLLNKKGENDVINLSSDNVSNNVKKLS